LFGREPMLQMIKTGTTECCGSNKTQHVWEIIDAYYPY
jgi:hypothetical protein